jgi:hypothetical protein
MASRGTKNPAKESEHSGTGPAHHAKMAVHSDSPPGIELDGKAHVIPLAQRTEGDRRKAARKKKD